MANSSLSKAVNLARVRELSRKLRRVGRTSARQIASNTPRLALPEALSCHLIAWPSVDHGIPEAAEIGFANVEAFWNFNDETLAQFENLVQESNVNLSSFYLPLPLLDPSRRAECVATATKAAGVLAAHGGQFLVIGPPGRPTGYRLSAREKATVVSTLNAMGKAAHKSGVRLAVHQHFGSALENVEDFEAILAKANPALVGACIDTAHVTKAGSDPVSLIRRLGDRVWMIHFKDLAYENSAPRFREVGKGEIDFGRVVDALVEVGFAGPMVMELDHTGTPAKSMRESVEFLLPILHEKNKLNVAIIGAGVISERYCETLQKSSAVRLVGCADLDQARSRKLAEKFAIEPMTVEALLNDPRIDIVVNLTPPLAHHSVSMQILAANKHLYSEKPLAISAIQARELQGVASRRGLMIAAAPDTLLGEGWQKAFSQIRQGVIGRPFNAKVSMVCHGHEQWHPNPDFYYQAGGGPLFDMGPYYLSALVEIFGRVKSVSAVTQTVQNQREIGSGPRQGEQVKVETPTHIEAVLQFENGATANLSMSFDVWASRQAQFEVHGTEGTALLPDPNGFGGPVEVWNRSTKEWRSTDVPKTPAARGLGVADMAEAIRAKRLPKAQGAVAAHVVEVMEAILEASELGLSRVGIELN